MAPNHRLAPEIVRQRLLIEGYFDAAVDAAWLRDFLLGLANHLELRAYDEPAIFSPVSGMGREENAGFDAFVPLIDSGISAYIWSSAHFASVVIYTCKGFDERAAENYAQRLLKLREGYVAQAF